MADHVDDGWWYEARRAFLADVLADVDVSEGIALDVGCGAGGSLAVLSALGAKLTVGTDLVPEALAHAVGKVPGAELLASRAEDVPLRSGTAGLLVSLDVLEHLDDDVAALREYHRLLRPGGLLIVTGPAYPGLWAEHDEWAGHRRRYTRQGMVSAVKTAGFEVERETNYFSFLVPPAILMRRTPLRRLFSGSDDDASASPLVSRVLGTAARLERAVLRRRPELSVGLSLLVVARRP